MHQRHLFLRSAFAALALLLWSLASFAAAAPSDDDAPDADDPPARAARLTLLSGDVGFRGSQDGDWSGAEINRPLTTGDALDLADGARAEIDFGGGQVRLDERTRATVARLDDNVASMRIDGGTASLRVDDAEAGTMFELRTPTISFTPSARGDFRVDVEPDGETTLTLLKGDGTVYGENGARYDVHANQSYTFADASLRDVRGGPVPRQDAFDQWVAERTGRYRGPSRDYVGSDVVGAADLDSNGSWDTAEDYGPIWYPTVAAQDWAPYRYGRWAYIGPWGWTWIDDAPWGYAPFHYGRWLQYRGRWGWCPGPRRVRAVYSPALVGFVGGAGWSVGVSSGPPVGWFPLGPRDVYCPPYRVSRNYFTRVNVTNVTVINRTVINNTYESVHRRGGLDRVPFAYRGNAQATTVVSRDDFRNGHRLGASRLQVRPEQLAHAGLTAEPATPLRPTGRGPGRGDRPPGAAWRDDGSRDRDGNRSPGEALHGRDDDRQPSVRWGSVDRNGSRDSQNDDRRDGGPRRNGNGRDDARNDAGRGDDRGSDPQRQPSVRWGSVDRNGSRDSRNDDRPDGGPRPSGSARDDARNDAGRGSDPQRQPPVRWGGRGDAQASRDDGASRRGPADRGPAPPQAAPAPSANPPSSGRDDGSNRSQPLPWRDRNRPSYERGPGVSSDPGGNPGARYRKESSNDRGPANVRPSPAPSVPAPSARTSAPQYQRGPSYGRGPEAGARMQAARPSAPQMPSRPSAPSAPPAANGGGGGTPHFGGGRQGGGSGGNARD